MGYELSVLVGVFIVPNVDVLDAKIYALRWLFYCRRDIYTRFFLHSFDLLSKMFQIALNQNYKKKSRKKISKETLITLTCRSKCGTFSRAEFNIKSRWTK